eukprot:3895116-Rhodomonas_salina.7
MSASLWSVTTKGGIPSPRPRTLPPKASPRPEPPPYPPFLFLPLLRPLRRGSDLGNSGNLRPLTVTDINGCRLARKGAASCSFLCFATLHVGVSRIGVGIGRWWSVSGSGVQSPTKSLTATAAPARSSATSPVAPLARAHSPHYP